MLVEEIYENTFLYLGHTTERNLISGQTKVPLGVCKRNQFQQASFRNGLKFMNINGLCVKVGIKA